MIMKRKLPERKAQTFRQKKWKKEKSNYLKALPALLQHQKHLNVKKTSSFAMHVDNKRKQIDAWSHKITEKAIMGILFEAEIGTTYVTSVQGQYSSSTPQTQNFWLDLLHNDWLYFIIDSIY